VKPKKHKCGDMPAAQKQLIVLSFFMSSFFSWKFSIILSICECHYNQIITTDHLYNSLLEQSNENDDMNVDDIQNYEEEELQKIKNMLDECQEIEQKTLHISNLLTQIGRLQQELSELTHKFQGLEKKQ